MTTTRLEEGTYDGQIISPDKRMEPNSARLMQAAPLVGTSSFDPDSLAIDDK